MRCWTWRRKNTQSDPKDKKILDMLKENARESFAAIGEAVNISESAVRRRVAAMESSGMIRGYTVRQDETGLTKAIVLVSVDSATDTSTVSAKLKKLDGILTVYEITGQYDIAVVMGAENIALINDGIDALRKIRGVIDTNTVIILRTVM